MNPAEVELREGLPEDFDAVLRLERAIPEAPHWSPAAYTEILAGHTRSDPPFSKGSRCLFVAKQAREDGPPEILGFAVGHVIREALPQVAAELESVVVDRSFRRAGIGRSLCVAVARWCRSEGAASMTLEVRRRSAVAVALYESLGFVEVGRRPRYYESPADDALIMKWEFGRSGV